MNAAYRPAPHRPAPEPRLKRPGRFPAGQGGNPAFQTGVVVENLKFQTAGCPAVRPLHRPLQQVAAAAHHLQPFGSGNRYVIQQSTQYVPLEG